MLSNAVIGLREGLEAALVVGILLAYLTKTDRLHLKRAVWGGVGAAVVVSIAVGVLLQQVSEDLGERAAETFAGAMSLAAVALVTWMIFWMRRTARSLRGELQGRLDAAAAISSASVGALAFVAVAREGVETALFMWTSIASGQHAVAGTFGAVLGLTVAVLLGRLILLGAIKMDLSKFFRISGAALVVVAGAVFAYGIHELQEAHLLPGEDWLAFDISAQVSKESAAGTLLSVLTGFGPTTSWLQVLAWAGYVAVVMAMFLRPQQSQRPTGGAPAPAAEPAPQSPAEVTQPVNR